MNETQARQIKARLRQETSNDRHHKDADVEADVASLRASLAYWMGFEIMSATVFEIDEATGKKIDDMSRFFGSLTRAETIRRCIALGIIAIEMADDKRNVTFINDAKESVVALSR